MICVVFAPRVVDVIELRMEKWRMKRDVPEFWGTCELLMRKRVQRVHYIKSFSVAPMNGANIYFRIEAFYFHLFFFFFVIFLFQSDYILFIFVSREYAVARKDLIKDYS